MSVEVAEHLQPASAETLIASLTGLADVVLFGSAYVEQGGADHINEQPHTYWDQLFRARGLVPFDLFRADVWGHPDVEFCYQQNCYVRRSPRVDCL